ncbi:MAG TPA: metallophosphoesterase, partial [Nitrospirae bacterium]|nr:metallophosphoesterase [Nitrospirota bacterium]
MNTFLSTFIFFYSVYGTAHVYAFLKVKYTFHPDVPESVSLGLFLALMMFSPSLMRFCSLRFSKRFSRTVAYVSYSWMALLLFFFSCGLIFDLYNLVLLALGYTLQKNLDSLFIPGPHAFYIPLLLAIPLSIYSYYEATDLRTGKLILKTSKLPEEIRKLTVAHISDLHLGIMVKDEMLDKIAEEIQRAKPDIIVSTGDMLEEEADHVTHLSGKLKNLDARLGKFAVTGNHDFFTDVSHSVKFMKDSGFKPLRGEGITVQNMINIAGIDDPLVKNT